MIMFIDLFEEEQENPDEFVSFIVFEPASLRIPDNDLLLIGDEVADLFNQVMSSDNFSNALQDQILLNRLQRIEMMIDLLKSNSGLILTKFLNKIWRRYAFFSNLGELFINQKDLQRLVPDYKFSENTVLDRIIESDDDDDGDDSDDQDKADDTDDSKNETTTTHKS